MHRSLRTFAVLAGLLMLALPSSALASHFRGGSITWTRSSGSSTTANFVVTHSWRVSPYINLVYSSGGSSGSLSHTSLGTFTDSTGASYTAYRSTTSQNFGSSSGSRTAYFSSCCRIGGLSNYSSAYFRVESVINFSGGNTASPAIGAPALLQMVPGAANSVSMSVVDPDNNESSTCSWSSVNQSTGSGSSSTQFRPSWLQLDTNNCVLYTNAGYTGSSAGQRWVYSVRVTDAYGAVTTFDGMIEMVNGTPPSCSGGGNFNVTVGQPFSTSFVGSNPSGGNVTFQVTGEPSGSTLSPTSGASGTTSTFNWTPQSSDFGQTYAATVIVTNSQNLQATCPLGLTVPVNSAPTAEANGPYAGAKGVGIPVTGVGSSDSDGTITNYAWDCDGNGSYEVSTSSVNATCGPFSLGGTYTAVLRVTDDQGGTDTDTATITIANVGPNAEAGGPYTTNQGNPVTISGAGSTDGDGGSLSYAWDCNTANGTSYSAGSATTSCTYPDDGPYTGSLRVCDPEGACDTDSFTVNVTNTPPVANAGGPYTTGQGVPVTVNGSSSTDPDGTISLYQWDCDISDGISYSAGSSSPTFSCSWPDDGVYTLSLRVTDDDGATATDTATATVTNTAPIANAGGPYTGQKNTQIALSGAASNDPDGSIVLYQWDCDASDGVNLSAGTASATTSCTYPTIGSYTVTLQVTDDDGATDTDTATVTISNAAPTANPGGPYSAIQGVLVLIDGSQSSDPDGSIVSYEWDCDASNGVSYSTPAPSQTFPCTYADDGTYTVTLRVTDDDGATDVGTATVIVTNQLPTAEAGGPYTGNQSAPMPVFAFGSSDPDGTIVSYEWDCTSDGTYDSSSASPTGDTCTYPNIGSYNVTLRVTDDDGGQATDVASVLIGNQPPVAAPGGPYAALQGSTVNIDGSASADTDGTIVDFSWDCDASDGVNFSSSAVVDNFLCFYPSVGTFTVTLRVTDDDGATDTQTTTVTVSNGAPVAVAGGPYTGNKNTTITVDGSFSSDPDGTIVNYAWDCDSDGVTEASSSSPTASCIYPNTGTFTATLTVTDNDGGTDSDTATVNVPTAAPTADAGGPYAGTQGVPIGLDGSGSTDPDGNIVTYEWDCEGDGIYEFSSFNSNDVTCTYSTVGVYTLQLRVTDDDGNTDTDTAVVTLTNILPVADAGGPYTGTEATPVAVDGTGSGDVDGSIVQYSWDCDSDGLPDVILPTPNGATCTYPGSGTYTITLTVTDDDGATDTDTATVTVVSSPPNANAGGPYSGNEGSLILLDASGSSDAGGNIVSYQWDCTSDGIFDISTTQPLGSGCSYEDEGNFTVTLQVTDNDGDSSTSVATIAVANVAPTLSVGGPTTGNEGQSMNWTATATDPGVNDVISYSWDFGDGESATGAAVTHTYLQDGTYTVTVSANDGDGGIDVETVTVVVGNLPPTLTVWTIPIASDEGQLLNFTAAATDPGVLDVLSYSWDFGDGGPGETGDVVNYAFADDGTYTITLTVTDDGGLTDSVTQVINVANVPPTITSMTGDLSGFESEVLSWEATATDPGVLDVLTYTWDFGDGTTATGTTVSHAYVNEGTYIITLTVDDGDGGVDTETLSVSVLNEPPTITSLTAPGGAEGDTLTYSVTATDVGVNDTLTYLWDFGDGTFGVGDTVTKVWDDDGTYPVVVTVTDDGGEFTIGEADVTVTNVAPVITSMVALPSAFPDEGSSVDFEATATDAGVADIPDLIYTWSFGDANNTTDTGDDSEFTYADDGTFTVTLTVDDQDGGVTTQTMVIEVQNVAPIISTNPVVNANQGSLYSYAPQVVDPGDEVFTWTLSPGAPAAMTIDPATGLIEWTPTYNDYLIGTHAVVLTVDDGDGGIDQQSWTITVFDTDTDGDGIPDDWEITNGLNPNDPTDAGDDPDGDGITNLGEFGLDQDPFTYDGPTVPVAIFPIGGEEVTEVSPDLIVENATDPQMEPLLYDFEIFEDELMTIPVTQVYGVIEGTNGETSWKVDVQLNEDQEYWWHARANDPWVAGPWTDVENFILNEFNDGPDVPELVYPIEDEVVTVLQPTMEWTQVEDPNGDEVTYDVIIWAEDETTVVAEVQGVADSGNPTSTWMVDVALVDDARYYWSARAVDDEGLAGDWAESESFFLTTEDGAPDQPFFVDPLDGDHIESQSPVLTATEVEDPEGGEVDYEFEIDQVGTFDSTDYRVASVPATDTGEVWWDLEQAGIVLDENEWAFARVRAFDQNNIASPPDTISFFVRGPNDAPPVPTLLLPEDESTVPGLGVNLVLGNVDDVEMDLVYYDFVLATDPELTEVVFEADAVAEGSGPAEGDDITSVLVPQTLLGEYWWTARAVDDRGDASAWAEPFRFVATGDQDTGPVVDPDSFVGGGGCRACASSVSADQAPAVLWILALLPGVLITRRRRS